MQDGRHEIRTLEMHTGGEPVRIVTAGYPEVAGATILDKRRYAAEHLDRLRHLLIFEPRGHRDMYGVIPHPPAMNTRSWPWISGSQTSAALRFGPATTTRRTS